MKNENGTLGYGCYSSTSMLGIVCMDVIECVCKGFNQNARVEVFVEVKLQKGLCFLQQGSVSVNEELLKVFGSCFRSGLMFGMCSISLLRLVLTRM